MANSSKYLVQVIIKGLKGDYSLVIEWFKIVFSHCESLMRLANEEEERLSSTVQVLDIMKAGLYSKDNTVAMWGCKILAKQAKAMHELGISDLAWDWFVADNGGLKALIDSVRKKHNLLWESAVSAICQFGRYNFQRLFTEYFSKELPDASEFMQIVSELIQHMVEYKPAKEEIINAGVLNNWIDFASRKADSDNPNVKERSAALSLLLDIWILFPNIVEEKAEYADFFIKLMQRANRDRNFNLQIVSITLLFKMLEMFAMEHNPYAPIVYKTLTFALVENHQKMVLREYMLSNFKVIFETFSTIPVAILLDPLIKQVKNIIINPIDQSLRRSYLFL